MPGGGATVQKNNIVGGRGGNRTGLNEQALALLAKEAQLVSSNHKEPDLFALQEKIYALTSERIPVTQLGNKITEIIRQRFGGVPRKRKNPSITADLKRLRASGIGSNPISRSIRIR